MLQKTKMCKFFGQGSCRKGNKCQFAHSRSDLQSRPNLHKTQLCMAFERNGTCRDGPACKYAHGQDELQANFKQASAQSLATDVQVVPVPVAVQVVMLSSMTGRSMVDCQLPSILPVAMMGAFPQCTNKNTNQFSEGMIVKGPKEDDTCSVQTTDEGLDLDFESVCTSRQTSEWCSISEDDASHQAGFDSGSASESRSVSDASSEASEDASLTAAQRMEPDFAQEAPKALDLSLQKTKMCKFFMQGSCTKGTRCNFSHDNNTLKARPSLYRTSLCMAFERSGSCKLGEDCKYAHGREQLRSAEVMPTGHAKSASAKPSSKTPSSEASVVKASLLSAQPRSNVLPHEASGVIVDVKNTFLCFRFQDSATRRRSISCHK
jgi:hypothetical protein